MRLSKSQREVLAQLVGQTDIAQRYGISRAVVNAWISRHDSFPAPVAEVAAGRFYLRDEVDAWMAANRPEHTVVQP